MESVQKRRAVNMEEMKFEELTELKEPERLLESAMPCQKLIMQYQCALL